MHCMEATHDTIPEAERRCAAAHLPPVVYLPVARMDGPDGPQVELRILDDDRTALLVYTALDRLHRGCGDHQRWILTPMEALDRWCRLEGPDEILVDVVLPEHLKHRLEDLL